MFGEKFTPLILALQDDLYEKWSLREFTTVDVESPWNHGALLPASG